ncbi:uncharacterized protein LOC141690694 [Apium graveolens]|uniref:uncharacterized protein LOC141690694 n=1 Tax=Apium graveolens TaxID=4045 RepID=UPI003D7ACBEB
MEEASVVRKILRAVPGKFLQIALNIEKFRDMKTMKVEEVIGRLKAHEERMKGRSESFGGQLLLTKEDWAKRTTNYGGTDQDEGGTVLLNEEKVFPDISRDGSTKSDNNLWYLDNGASHHMTGHREKFSELNKNVTGNVRFGYGSTVKIEGKGMIVFKCKNRDELKLKNVYFIPSLCNNIISLGQFSKNGNKVVLNGDNLWVYDSHGRLLMKVQRSANSWEHVLVSLVDDYSHAMWVYMLRYKDQALEIFKHFKVVVEKEAKNTIKTLRTDRGGEFNSKEFNDFCANAGIKRHLTVPYTPQQNRVIERRNRTVVGMIRSLLKEKSMPATMWGRGHETFSVQKVGLGKLDDRSEHMFYIGKEPGTKAHRFYNPTTERLHISRDVVFEEGKGWDWDHGDVKEEKAVDRFMLVNTNTNTGDDREIGTESPHTPRSSIQGITGYDFQASGNSSESGYSSESGNSSEPRKFHLISVIYDETSEIEIMDELLLLGVEEPKTFEEAKDKKNGARL